MKLNLPFGGTRAMNVIVPITKRTEMKNYNGFAIPLQLQTDLGNAMLVAEDDEANYEPVAVAINISEGKEIAHSDLRERMRRLERDQHLGLCPYQYKLWARGVDGRQHVAATWLATEL
jgi:hypothetical protein